MARRPATKNADKSVPGLDQRGLGRGVSLVSFRQKRDPPGGPRMASEQPYAKDEQELWIGQASKNVKKCAFYMKKAIVSDHPQIVVKQAATAFSLLFLREA